MAEKEALGKRVEDQSIRGSALDPVQHPKERDQGKKREKLVTE